MSFKGYGTLPYIAPEAWNSDKNTVQMDIYSMGIVFYELATLMYPYELNSNDVESYKNVHLFSRIRNIANLQDAVGVEVASIIMTMLQKPIQKRFRSWDEIEKQLENTESIKEDGMNSVVSMAISKKIQNDAQKQQQIETENKKHKHGVNNLKEALEGIDASSMFSSSIEIFDENKFLVYLGELLQK